MSDLLTIGAAASNAFRKALEVTSHNVANVNTEGYSRQRAEITSMNPVISGNTMLGGGSQVSKVERVYSDYVQKQLVSAHTSMKGYEESYAYGKQIEGIIASNDQGVQAFMQRYFDALHDLADEPTSRVARELVLEQANSLAGHIGNVTELLKDTNDQMNRQITDLTGEINQKLQSIQKLNEQVMNAEARAVQPPNDLLDKREQAIHELSGLVDLQTFKQPNGVIDIFATSGQARIPILADNNITSLHADRSPYVNENRTELYVHIGGERRVVTDFFHGGGQLGGLLDVRRDVLDKAQNELGTTLNAMVAANNWQQYMGFDANGEPGQDLFKPLEATALKNVNNTGAEDGSNIKVTFQPNDFGNERLNESSDLTDPNYGQALQQFNDANEKIGQLVGREYLLRYDGTSFQVYDNQTKQPLEVLDEDGDPITLGDSADSGWLDGLRFDVSDLGPTQSGDQFVIKPHKAIMEQFSVSLTKGEELATRGQNPISLDRDQDTTGIVNPNTGVDYDLSDNDEWQTFLENEVDRDPAADGDNVNIANMASLQSKKIMYATGGGTPTESLLGGYSKMAVNVGSFVRSAEVNFESQQASYNFIFERRESISGVSLDEEAANLMRFQQAYQAAAQIMQASQTMFQTLLGVVRG